MQVLLEILKFTMPALIVFGTVYFILTKFYKNQEQMAAIKARADMSDSLRRIKLQAYERLALFCERIDVANLAQRLASRDMTADELLAAMLISVQKEYEHNVVQQIYVSEKLWQIISLAKSETISIVKNAHQSCANDATARDLLLEIQKIVEQAKLNPSEQAKLALRSETELILS